MDDNPPEHSLHNLHRLCLGSPRLAGSQQVQQLQRLEQQQQTSSSSGEMRTNGSDNGRTAAEANGMMKEDEDSQMMDYTGGDTTPSHSSPLSLSLPGWHEAESTRIWAKQNLTSAPPPFGSSARHHLRAMLDEQRRKIQELRDVEQQIRAQLAPVRLMPPEILSNIFILSTPENFAFREDKWPSNPILSVCSNWRNIALATQQLWSRFHLDTLVDVKALRDPRRAYSEPLQSWMKRAGNGPWDVRMFEGPYNFHVWRCVLQQVSNWRSWQYCGDESTVWFFLLCGKFAKILQTMRLTCFASEGPNASLNKACADRLGGIIEFPELTTLHLYGTAREIIPYISGPRVTELILGNPLMEDLDLCAKAFPSLQYLSIIKLRLSECITDAPTLAFPNISSCEWLATTSEPCNGSVLSCMPQLTTLRVACSLACINHCVLPSVTTLELVANAGIGSIASKEWFGMFPNARELFIQNNSWATAILSILTQNLELCPKLELVTVVGGRIDRTTLVDFASVRAPSAEAVVVDLNDAETDGQYSRCLVTLTNCQYEERYTYGKQKIPKNVVRADIDVIKDLW